MISRPFFLLLVSILFGSFGFVSCQVGVSKTESQQPAVALTPAKKRYKDALETRLGSHWYRLIELNVDALDLGTVTTTFEIPAEGGPVRHVKVTSNTGNLMDAKIALRAIAQLRAPPMPPELLKELDHDSLQVEESFTVFGQNFPPPHVSIPVRKSAPNSVR